MGKAKPKKVLPKIIVNKKLIRYSSFVIGGLFVLFLVIFGIYSALYSNKIFARQFIGGINLAGKNKAEAKEVLSEKSREFQSSEIVLVLQSEPAKNYPIKAEEVALQYDIAATVDKIWKVGRGGGIIDDLKDQIKSIFIRTKHQTSYTINEESLNQKIKAIAAETDKPEKDFSIIYDEEKFVLSTERAEGERIDQDKLIQKIKSNIGDLNKDQIGFRTDYYKPKISLENAQKRLGEANQILDAGNLTLEFEAQQFAIDKDMIGGFIKSRIKDEDMELYLEAERSKAFVVSVANGINVEPNNAILQVVNGKVTVKDPATLGKTLDQIQTVVDIENSLFARIEAREVKADPKKIILKVEVKKPEITDETIATLGLNELVGTGMTDFKKSPANRVHNIQIGAKAINGALVKPGETFSTLARLGKIDATTGYLQELVIKENRTIPEFGGGLCQVSSTLFRAVLNSGLKITERQNHKYRVSYYEPPVGMDATIYDPSPDFKFVNNFDHYIFIQSQVTGTKITFDIYGTKDGRIIEISAPEIYDIVEPGPPLDIETDTLPAGERKLIEKAHQGASAKFNYKVTKTDKVLQEKTFVSKYVPWQEKWLVGKGAPPVPPAEPAPVPEVPPAPTI